MDELAERIKVSIENPNAELWFPELTADLAARAWESLYSEIGLTPDSYSTERVLLRRVSAPREIVTFLKTCPSTCATAPPIAIEELSAESTLEYQEQGVSFYSADEILHSSILSSLEDALAIIKQVPSLMKTVATLVRSLHVLKPEDVDYDVSFSEPHVRFSIFVSVPEKRIANDALRVAEAIVHEAMHLQLTLIEKCCVSLVRGECQRYFSPWREEFRNAGGLLHGLYVFAVIEMLLGTVTPDFLVKTTEVRYVFDRRREIQKQVAGLECFKFSNELTEIGALLVNRLVKLSRTVGSLPRKLSIDRR